MTAKSMFGGVGIYAQGFFFALIAEDRLYFKVDDSNRPDFVAAGMGPFMPFGDPDRPMQYYELPEEVLEDPELLAPWMTKAIAVAMKAKPKAKQGPKAKAKPKAAAKPKAMRK